MFAARQSSFQAALVIVGVLCFSATHVRAQSSTAIVTRSSEEILANVTTWHEPVVSPLARQAHAGGPVEVELLIGARGNVIKARIVSGHPLLRSAVLTAARAWKFKPFTVKARPVTVKGRVTYSFDEVAFNDKTLSELERQVRLTPNSAEAHYELGGGYFDALRYPEAIVQLNEAIKIDPKLFDAQLMLGHAYARVFQHDKAKVAYEEAIRLDPNRSEPWHALGLVYIYFREFEEAVAVLEKSLQVEGPITTTYFLLGKCYFMLGRPKEAVELYKQGLAKYPENDSGHFGLGEALLEIEQYDEAITELKEAIRLSNGQGLSNALYYLGLAYLRSGDRKAALKQYELLKSRNEELARQLMQEIRKPTTRSLS